MTRYEAPYPSKCTKSWEGTSLSQLVKRATKKKETELHYKLAVNNPKNWRNNNFQFLIFQLCSNYEWNFCNILQLCQRMCLFNEVVEKCQCLHPVYTDFDALRNPKYTTNGTSRLEVCNLIAGGIRLHIQNFQMNVVMFNIRKCNYISSYNHFF